MERGRVLLLELKLELGWVVYSYGQVEDGGSASDTQLVITAERTSA